MDRTEEVDRIYYEHVAECSECTPEMRKKGANFGGVLVDIYESYYSGTTGKREVTHTTDDDAVLFGMGLADSSLPRLVIAWELTPDMCAVAAAYPLVRALARDDVIVIETPSANDITFIIRAI